MRLYSRLLCTAAIAAFAGQAYAGAWTQDAGHAQVIMSGLYYSANRLWDTHGIRQTQPTYDKYELNPYIEYGVWDDVTIGANLSLQRTHQDASATGISHSNWGIGDSEFFLRKRLWQGNGFVFSAEPMIKLPSPGASGNQPQIGSTRPDIGMGLSGGYGFSAWGLNHFADIDTQYRHRFGAKDQIKLSATAGIGITPQWMLMPQTFITYRASTPSVSNFTQSSADDYNLVRLQLSAVYKVSDSVSLQFGGFDDIAGKNAGMGSGVLFAVWKRF